MKKRFATLLILPAILLSNPFELTLENEISWLQEETFVISASRVKENIKKASASITVIDEDTINKMGANNIMDVLRTISGLGISQSNIYMDKIAVSIKEDTKNLDNLLKEADIALYQAKDRGRNISIFRD